jgi:hypothetical protein
MHWIKITTENVPEGTVIATDFIDDPVIGQIIARKDKFYCLLPYFNPDDGCKYREEVTHFITLHDFDHAVEPFPYGA